MGIILSFGLAALPVCPAAALSGPSANIQYYFDSRDFNTFAVTVGTDRLPLGWTFWGFTDLHGAEKDAHHASDAARSFSEYRLSHTAPERWFGIKGLGFQAEYNDATPGSSDLIRAGLTFKHAVTAPWLKKADSTSGWLQWRAFPYETDGSGGQASVVMMVPIHDRVVLSGFADFNWIEKGTDRWVVEPQINLKLDERIWAILEFRYNGFEDANPALRGKGWASGLRFDF